MKNKQYSGSKLSGDFKTMSNSGAEISDKDIPAISRRKAVKLFAAGGVSLALPNWLKADIPAASGQPSLNVFKDYSWLRGFSVIPSWGARIEEAWWFYNPERMREEVSLAAKVHANCIRLWIEFTAWMADPDKITKCFLDAVAAIDEAGMKTMPCLFNRWHNDTWDYGGTYTEDLFASWKPKLEYVRSLVLPLIKDDRILIWDLCNEPQAKDLINDVDRREFEFLKLIAQTVRECGALQPITIGTMQNDGNIAVFAPLTDVLCGHPYDHTRADLQNRIASYREAQNKFGKPFLVNESVPGCLDDIIRAKTAGFYNELLSEAGFGWMGWALCEGKAISTRRDRYDGNGINQEGFHPFFTRDGKLRDGLEFLTERPLKSAPWKE